MNEKDKERYSKWQDHRIQHLGYSSNLFLGFAVASITFAIAHEDDVSEVILYWWYISVSVGVISTISRLVDFRYTCKKIKSEKENHKIIARWAGHITWITFGVQLASYCIGATKFLMEQ